MKKLGKVEYLVVHCSASKWGDAKEIDRWHKERGWEMIGYHAVILNGCRTASLKYDATLDGKVEPGRPEKYVGAQCQAHGMNFKSLGVCIIGIPRVGRYPTVKQYAALVWWLAEHCEAYHLDPNKAVTQHSVLESDKPYCASLNLTTLRSRVVEAMKHINEARNKK
jgi:hypothetical protein